MPTAQEIQDFTVKLVMDGATPEEVEQKKLEKWPELKPADPPPPGGDNPPAPASGGDEVKGMTPEQAYGGLFGSLEEFHAGMAEYAQMKTTLEQTQNNYNALVSGIKNFSAPHIDEAAANYNKFIQSTGIKDMGLFHRVSGFNPEGLNQNDVNQVIEAIALAKVIENPALDKNYTELVNRIKSEHTKTIPPVEEDGEPTQQIDTLGLQMSFGPASTTINQLKSKYENFKPEGLEEGALDVEQFLKTRAESASALKEQWTPVINSLISNTKEVSVWGGENPYQMQLPEGGLKPYTDALLNSAVASGKAPDQEMVKHLMGQASMLYTANNVEAIAKSYVADVLKANDLELENPTIIKRNNDGDGGGGDKPNPRKEADEFIRSGTHYVGS